MRKYFDFAGMFVSLLCIVHCIALPFVMFFLPTYGMTFLESGIPGNEDLIHKAFLVLVVLSAVFPFMKGYNIHQKFIPIALFVMGFALFVFSAFFVHDLIGHQYEQYVGISGSLFLIAGHYLNHRFCNHCDSHKHLHDFSPQKTS